MARKMHGVHVTTRARLTCAITLRPIQTVGPVTIDPPEVASSLVAPPACENPTLNPDDPDIGLSLHGSMKNHVLGLVIYGTW